MRSRSATAVGMVFVAVYEIDTYPAILRELKLDRICRLFRKGYRIGYATNWVSTLP